MMKLHVFIASFAVAVGVALPVAQVKDSEILELMGALATAKIPFGPAPKGCSKYEILVGKYLVTCHPMRKLTFFQLVEPASLGLLG